MTQSTFDEQEAIIRCYLDLFVEKLKPFAATAQPANMCDWFSKSKSPSPSPLLER